MYRTILGSRIRSQLAYRTSFCSMLSPRSPSGWSSSLSSTRSWQMRQSSAGLTCRRLPWFSPSPAWDSLLQMWSSASRTRCRPTLRLGRLEVMLVWPMPLMLQLITSDFQLRRLGRVAINVVIIFRALPTLQLDYTPGTIYLLLITPFVGAAIYAAFFATAGGLQFFLINGAEFTSAFVYGGAYAGQLPGSVLITPVRVWCAFVFPATVTAYLPALLIMGLEGPSFLPAWLGWFAPLFAVWAWLLAWLAWRGRDVSIHRGWWLM